MEVKYSVSNIAKKTMKFTPLITIIIASLIIGTLAYASISISKGITYSTQDGGNIFFNFDFSTSRLYFDNGVLMVNSLNGVFSSMGFRCETESANMTITKISMDEIRFTVDAPSDTTSITKIKSNYITKPADIQGCSSWSYSIFTKTITINVLHNSPANIIISWGASDVMIDNILQGTIIQGIISYYTSTIGVVPFYGIMILGITLLAYIWTQSLEFIAVIWILIGGGLEIFIPGPILSIGKILMVLGIFLIFIKLFLGKSDYG